MDDDVDFHVKENDSGDENAALDLSQREANSTTLYYMQIHKLENTKLF